MKNFASFTDTNSLLNRGRLFVFSTDHIAQLLLAKEDYDKDKDNWSSYNQFTTDRDLNSAKRLKPVFKNALDIGAGCGDTTDSLAPLFETVHALETSFMMQRTLASKGYYPPPSATESSSGYNVVFLLNVLDRCEDPVSLLKYARSMLKKRNTFDRDGGGKLVIGSVLPYHPFVETRYGSFFGLLKTQMTPKTCLFRESAKQNGSKRLGIAKSRCMYCNIQDFADMLETFGLEIERWSRLPYFSTGDYYAPWYLLDQFIFVLKEKE
eukprot:g3467.t1